MTSAENPRTLRDHLGFLRRNVWLILAVTAIAAAAAVALSLSESKRYSASAKIYFTDPIAQAGVVGVPAANTPPARFASAGTSRLTAASTLRAVKKSLKTPMSIADLKSRISSVTDPTSFVVTVTATGPTAPFAANLANAVTEQAKADEDAAASRQFGTIAQNFRTQIDNLTPSQRRNQLTFSALYDNYSRALALSKGGAVGAQIQSRASVPSSPSAPKPLFNGIVGGVLGLVLGLIIARVRESLDRRLRGPGEIESSLQLPIVGHVREEALGGTPGAANGRPHIDDLDLEAFRILRTNVEFLAADKPIRTIAVTSALPEEGKTTVASSLASVMAAAGRRTLLVDCDLRRPTLSQRLGVSPRPGLTDFLAGAATPQEVVRTLEIGTGPNGNTGPDDGDLGVDRNRAGVFACITSGARTERPAELLGSARFQEFLGQIARAYDVVVLDTAPLLPVADTLEFLPSVDVVLVCLRASRTTRDQALAAQVALSRLPEQRIGVVLTGARDRHDYGSYYPYSYSYAYRSTESGSSGASAQTESDTRA